MIIILEGPDGAGKTFLAQKLQKEFGLEYHHEGPPPKNIHPLHHYGRVLDGFRGKRVVIDRLCLGERVYGPLLRGEDKIGERGWTVFSRLAMAVGAYQVICLPPFETCYESWKGRKGELFQEDVSLLKTWVAYANLAFSLMYRGQVVYDWTRTSFEELTYGWDDIETYRPTWKNRAVIGNPTARILLVGEQVGNTSGVDLPFFSTWGSSQYLTDALRMADLFEFEVAWVNAFSADGFANRITPFNALGMTMEVVALGQAASRACMLQGVQHRTVSHPQYHMRFHHHEMAAYAAQLKGVGREPTPGV